MIRDIDVITELNRRNLLHTRQDGDLLLTGLSLQSPNSWVLGGVYLNAGPLRLALVMKDKQVNVWKAEIDGTGLTAKERATFTTLLRKMGL